MYKGYLENQIVHLVWESPLLLVLLIDKYSYSNFWQMEEQKTPVRGCRLDFPEG